MMNNIIKSVENDSGNFNESIQMQNKHDSSTTDAITNAAYTISENAKAKAIVDGRPSPNINDIQSLAFPILRHRVLPNFNAEAEGLKVEDILTQLLDIIVE